MSNQQLHSFAGFTLVDITATGVTRGVDEQKRNQQRNWETVLQAIGLGAQPVDVQLPVESIFTDISITEFGDIYSGEQKVWIWSFTVEHADVFRIKDDPVGRLEEYFSQVPIICGLEETARFMLPIFYPYGAIKNVYFKSISDYINNT